ncbi:MAG: shikimate dehydrogenase [Chloroflexi bacterium]|nr:shikimate dehydrogenase [Chloroflexota bacterium]
MENRAISGKTKLCGIIGDPVEHTISPAMHNAAFLKTGLDYLYVPFRVKKEALAEAIAGMRALNIRGLNVTIPHKVAVLQYLDKLDPLADKIGAVNTIVNDNGVLTGYNTDADGFLQALLEKDIEPKGQNVVILGAGGASRAVSFILAERGANLVIINRSPDSARKLAGSILPASDKKVVASELNKENLAKALSKADMLVNTTSLGMVPDADHTPVAADLLRRGLIVFDIVYNPVKTRLLKEAKSAGAKIIGGLDMLVWQGALAFEKWTGRKAPVELMRQEATKLLRNYEN